MNKHRQSPHTVYELKVNDHTEAYCRSGPGINTACHTSLEKYLENTDKVTLEFRDKRYISEGYINFSPVNTTWSFTKIG